MSYGGSTYEWESGRIVRAVWREASGWHPPMSLRERDDKVRDVGEGMGIPGIYFDLYGDESLEQIEARWKAARGLGYIAGSAPTAALEAVLATPGVKSAIVMGRMLLVELHDEFDDHEDGRRTALRAALVAFRSKPDSARVAVVQAWGLL